MGVWEDITRQVENLTSVLDSHAGDRSGRLDRAAEVLAQARWIVYCGIGTGLFSCLPASYYLLREGRAASYLDATEAVYDVLPGLRDSVLVLNTRSGETAEMVKLAKLAHDAGIRTVAVTNELESTVGRLAEMAVPTHSRWDDLVVLSNFGGLMASELLLAGSAVGKTIEMLADLRRAAARIEEVLEQVVAKRAAMAEFVGDARPIYLLGRGSSLAAAFGGELVLEELSRRPAMAMAAGYFRQGPFEVVDERVSVVVFAGSGEHRRLNRDLARTLLACGAKVLWVSAEPLEGAFSIELPDLPPHALPLLEIVPCHVLAYDLALAAGITPGSVRYIKQVITSEEGLPSAD